MYLSLHTPVRIVCNSKQTQVTICTYGTDYITRDMQHVWQYFKKYLLMHIHCLFCFLSNVRVGAPRKGTTYRAPGSCTSRGVT